MKQKLVAVAIALAVAGGLGVLLLQPSEVSAQAGLPPASALKTPAVLPQSPHPPACVCSEPLRIGAAGSIRNCQCGTLQCVVSIPSEFKGDEKHALQCVR